MARTLPCGMLESSPLYLHTSNTMATLRKRTLTSSPILPGDDVMSESTLEKERLLGFSDDEESIPPMKNGRGVTKQELAMPPSIASDVITDTSAQSQYTAEAEEVEGDIEIFNKAIHITNLEKVDHATLLHKMHDRFKKKVNKWEQLAYTYSRYAFAMNFTILLLQVLQMILQQTASAWMVSERTILTTHSLLTALTALIAGLQLKLKMSDKAERYRRGAKVYGRLLRISTYYIMMIESGGKIEDVTGLWREAMKKEGKWIPLVRTFVPL
ncbi:uncharacterized protein LOC120340790 isoform X3 [Styela clava]